MILMIVTFKESVDYHIINDNDIERVSGQL